MEKKRYIHPVAEVMETEAEELLQSSFTSEWSEDDAEETAKSRERLEWFILMGLD